ncbi:MAG: helix-turn-helix domain-containing protein [Ilumatobacteraceae bacterium]
MSATTRSANTSKRHERHERTYGQFCPIAAGLDLLGDRWVLLICRELSFGDQRFTDLRTQLPGIAPNLLSERLRTLQDAGLVVTAELPPPAARTVYRLSAEGRRVVPVLRAVARFGAPYLDGQPAADFSARSAAFALLAPWWRQPAAPTAPRRYRLVLGPAADGNVIDLLADGPRISVVATDPEEPADIVIAATVDELSAARKSEGVLTAAVTGTAAARRTFYESFDLRPAGA